MAPQGGNLSSFAMLGDEAHLRRKGKGSRENEASALGRPPAPASTDKAA